jgi:AmmeMemoRadiSam system protein A
MCPLPDHRLISVSAQSHPDEFSPEERALLLRLAHESINAAFEQREIALEAPTAHLAEPRGVFTTLYYRGGLRGCVGYVLPVAALFRTVAESARGAAFKDSRFAPVTPEEAAELKVSLSVLSPPQPIAPDEVEIGRHGLLVSLPPYRGLLLPQVAVEHGWDRTTFLEQTCLKAGLPANAWQQGARIEAFTAEIFADSE